MERVVITGTGILTPFGQGLDTAWDSLLKNRSAVVNMKEKWSPRIKDIDCWVGAPLQEHIDIKRIPRTLRKTMGNSGIYSYLVTQDALKESGISEEMLSGGRMGVAFGSTTGSTQAMEDVFFQMFKNQEKRDLPSSIFFRIMSHTNAANIAQAFNIKGRVYSPNSACSSAGQAIGLGYEMIKSGLQDAMICGGAEELMYITAGVFDMVQAASYHFNEDPELTPRPFDKDRDGTVCAEGAGALILESLSSALKRGAPILGEVIGYSTLSGGSHIATPDTGSIAACMKDALEDAGISIDEIDYINAHATGTLMGDSSEAQAILSLFGDKTPPVSSIKGFMGHTLGASAAIEVILSLHMMQKGVIIPNRNFKKNSKEFAELPVLTDYREKKVETVLKNSSAFGGINTSLILRRYHKI